MIDTSKTHTLKAGAQQAFLLASAIIVGIGASIGLLEHGPFDFSHLHYFTYLSNFLMVFGYLTLFVLRTKGEEKPWTTYLSATIVVALLATGIIYNLILVPFMGADPATSRYASFSTHVIAPTLALLYYALFAEKGALTTRHMLVALGFPVLYWLAFMIVGAVTGHYPYPFMDPATDGIFAVAFWALAILTLFATIAAAIYALDHLMGKLTKRI